MWETAIFRRKVSKYFDTLLSDSESEETNLTTCMWQNNFILWNQRQQNARCFETSFVTSEGTAFHMLCQESVIFRESTAGSNSYF